MGLYGALRGLSATAKIVRGVQLTGTALKIKRKVDRMSDKYHRMIRRNTANSSPKTAVKRTAVTPQISGETMTGQYIARISKQSRV